MWITALAACGPRDPGTAGPRSGTDSAVAAPVFVVDPPSLFFGVVPWGQTGTSRVTLRNDGDGSVRVDLVPSTEDLVLLESGPFEIAAGAEHDLVAEWTATAVDGLRAELELRVDGGAPIVVPAVAVASYGELTTWSGDDFDLGTVSVGCDETLHIVLVNRGDADVVVADVDLTVKDDFVLSDYDGTPVGTPLSVAPGSTHTFSLTYTPTEERETATTVEVTSDDPVTPVLGVHVAATARVDSVEAFEVSWTVPPTPEVMSALVHVNHEVADSYESEIEDALPGFFDALASSGVPFRLAIIGTLAGGDYVAGSIPYIDDTFSTDEAVDAASEMIEGMTSDDNDAGLETLAAAVERHRDWLLDENAVWSGSRLNLVAVNHDAEQSSRDATFWVDELRTYKASADQVVVHGLAGDERSGCTGTDGATSALASDMLADAVTLTYGTFLSICDAWDANFRALAESLEPSGIIHFPLEHEPMRDSLTVSVDGAPSEEGWTYDATTNAVVFDGEHRPPEGAEVVVAYTTLPHGCE